MTKSQPKPVIVRTANGDILRIKGERPVSPSWATSKPMPPAPSEKYTQKGDNL